MIASQKYVFLISNECFIYSSVLYTVGAGITMTAGIRIAFKLFIINRFMLFSFQLLDQKSPALLLIATTFPSWDWVICTPTAFLGCGIHFLGSLSRIKPCYPLKPALVFTASKYNKENIFKSL